MADKKDRTKVEATTETKVTTKIKKTTKKKKNDKVSIFIVLDKSGSMGSITDSTIKGVNDLILEQRQAQGSAEITLVTFDNKANVVYDRVDINEVEFLTKESYTPNGMTAMYDGIGLTLDRINKSDDAIIVIVTDGQENASREYNHQIIKERLSDGETNKGWNVIFLGANINVQQTSAGLGLNSRGKSVNYTQTAENATKMWGIISDKFTSYRSAKFSADVNASTTLDFSDEDIENLNK